MSSFDSNLRQQAIDNQLSLVENSKNVLILNSNPELFEKSLQNKDCKIEIIKLELDEIFDFSILNGKIFQVILLDNILQNYSNPKIFLQEIKKFLSSNGFLICSSYNINNSINRTKFLDGNIDSTNPIFQNKQLFFSSLDKILLSLSEIGFSISKLLRIKKQVTLENQTQLKNFVLPKELLTSFSNDLESNTFFYVFKIVPNSKVNFQTRKFVSTFSKNLVTEKLNEIFDQIRLDFEKKIAYLKSNQEQYAHIKQIIKDKDAYAEQLIKDKDEIINSLQQSSAFKLLRTLDKLHRKK